MSRADVCTGDECLSVPTRFNPRGMGRRAFYVSAQTGFAFFFELAVF